MSQQYSDRYPGIAFLLHVTNPPVVYDDPISLPLPHADTVYHFGLEGGARFTELSAWLAQEKKRKLIFLDDRLGAFLELEKELIDHPQVELHYIEHWEETLEHLALKNPEREIAIEGKERFSQYKETLQKKTWVYHALSVDILQADILFANVAKNLQHLPRTFCLKPLKNRFRSVPAVICGAGPSLTHDLDPTRQLIIACGSAIPILSKRGIEPHFAIAFDPNPEEFDRLKQTDNFSTPLLFSARLHPEAICVGNFPLGYIPTNTSGLACDYIERESGFSPVLEGLSEAAQTVTSAALSFAKYIGCGPIILTGIDLAYRNDARYAEGIAESGAQKRSAGPGGDPLKQVGELTTSLVWQLEADAIAHFAENFSGTVYNLSGGLRVNHTEDICAMPAFPQRDLYGAVHAATQKKVESDPTAALEKLLQSAKKTAALLPEGQDEIAYRCFVEPLRLFCRENLWYELGLAMLKKIQM